MRPTRAYKYFNGKAWLLGITRCLRLLVDASEVILLLLFIKEKWGTLPEFQGKVERISNNYIEHH